MDDYCALYKYNPKKYKHTLECDNYFIKFPEILADIMNNTVDSEKITEKAFENYIPKLYPEHIIFFSVVFTLVCILGLKAFNM